MIKIYIIIFTLIFNLCLSEAYARESVKLEKTASLDIEHLESLAQTHNVPLFALLGILATEKGKVGEAFQNGNGTWDLGAFQINTIHINEIVEMGIDPFAVLSNAKVNADIAVWLLSKHLSQDADIWNAIGKYHSKTSVHKERYTQAVKNNIKGLQQDKNSIDNLLKYINN